MAPPAAFSSKLSAVRLGLVGFSIISGGPFGFETAVAPLGAFVASAGLLLFGLLWALPQCWATADLAIALPLSGGQVQWIHAVLGRRAGTVNSLLMALWQVIDLPSALALLAAYISQAFPDLTTGQLYGINVGVVALALVVNSLPVDALAWTAGTLTAIALSPFPALAVAGGVMAARGNIPPFAWSALGPSAAPQGWESNFSVGLATLLWCSNGYWAIGALAAEVHDPRTNYRPGMALSAALAITAFVVPTMIASGFAPDYAAWQAGYFVTVGTNVAPWLGRWMLAAAALNSVVCFVANFGAYARGIAASSVRRDIPVALLAWHPRSWSTSPVVALAVLAVTTCILMAFSFDSLIVVNSSVALLMNEMLFVAHAWWHWSRAGDKGPRQWMPLAKVLALCTLPTTALTVFSVYVLASQSWWGPAAAAGVGAAALGIALVTHRCLPPPPPPPLPGTDAATVEAAAAPLLPLAPIADDVDPLHARVADAALLPIN